MREKTILVFKRKRHKRNVEEINYQHLIKLPTIILGMPTISRLIVNEKQQLTKPSLLFSFFALEFALRCETGVLYPEDAKLMTGL